MATYTFENGSQYRVPDNWGVGETLNYLSDYFPDALAGAGYTPNMENEYDTRTGVQDWGVRWGQALASGNTEEGAAELDAQVGVGNWGVHENGKVWVRPEGLRRLGKTPTSDKKVFVDPVRTDFFDAVDVGPEALKILAMFGAELALPAPGSAVLGIPILRSILSRTTGGMALRGGLSVAGADVGLEEAQRWRGTQRETLGEIAQHAGVEGATVAGLTYGIGLPFKALAALTGRAKAGIQSTVKASAPAVEQARQRVSQTVAGLRAADPQAIAMSPTAIIEAENSIVDLLTSRGVPYKDIPLATIYSLVKDNPGLIGITMSNLERAGSFAQPTQHLLKTLESLPTIIQKLREVGSKEPDLLTGITRVKAMLSKSEKRVVGEVLGNERVLAGVATGKDMSLITGAGGTAKKLFSEMNAVELARALVSFTDKQFSYGMKAFTEKGFYGTVKDPNPLLNLGAWSGYRVTPIRARNFRTKLQLADKGKTGGLIAMTPEVQGAVAPEMGNYLKTLTGGYAIQQIDRFLATAAFKPPVKGKPKSNINQFTAKDAYDISLAIKKNLRTKAMAGAPNRMLRSDAVKATNRFQELAVKTPGVPKTARAEMNRIQRDFSNFVRPHATIDDFILKSSALKSVDDPVQLFQDVVKGRSGVMFSEWAEAVERGLVGSEIPGIGMMPNGLTPTMFWSAFSHQVMHSLRKRFNLDLSPEAFSKKYNFQDLQNSALSVIDYLEITGRYQGPRVKEAMNKVTGTPFFKEWVDSLRATAEGKRHGVRNLAQFLSKDKSNTLITQIDATLQGMGGASGPMLMQQLRHSMKQMGKLDPKSVQMLRDDYIYPVLNSQLYYAKGLGTSAPLESTGLLMNWADNIIRANDIGKNAVTGVNEQLKFILGPKDYLTYVNFATLLKASFEMFSKQGMLAAASQPSLAVRAMAQLNARGIVTPLVMLNIFKQMTPRSPAWFKAREFAKSGKVMSLGQMTEALRTSKFKDGLGQTVEVAKGAVANVSGPISKGVSSIIQRGIRNAHAALAVRNGIFAASIANNLNEQDSSIPRSSELDRILPNKGAQVAPEAVEAVPQELSMQDRESQIGKSMLAAQTLLNSAPSAPPPAVADVEAALAQGRSIAQGGAT